MKANINSYRDLIVWQKAMDLCEEVYRLARMLPKEELFALSDQLRRAAISIPSNIAEGRGRQSKKEFAHFLSIAQGSVAELETQIFLSFRLNMLQESDILSVLSLCTEVSKMLRALRTRLTPNA